jgi:cation-transporting ATPase E
VRSDAAEILAWFGRQGVTIKVISGDDPRTVGAIAAQAGLDVAPGAVDGRSLPDEPDALGDAVESATVFGRVAPATKRAMVDALQRRGHVVAMTGDGVNDVLALRDADVGVAMASGSGATRAAAELVLLDSTFASLPAAVAEGRRVIGNIERTGNLFLSKTVYATLLALAVGAARLPFPFLPRHLTLISALTIGIPGLFLALVSTDRPVRSGFIERILRFAIPAGAIAAVCTFVTYALARGPFGHTQLVARSVATMVLFGVGLTILAAIAWPIRGMIRWLVGAMGAIFVGVLLVPVVRRPLELTEPPLHLVVLAVAVVAVVAPILWWLARRSGAQGA